MKLVLNIYYHGEVIYVLIFFFFFFGGGGSPVIAELLSFHCLNFNDFFRTQP